MSYQFSNIDIYRLTLKVLENIPTHREAAKSPDEIIASVAQELSLSYDIVLGLTISNFAYLSLFDVLLWEGKLCKIKSQIPDYFVKSLGWYLANNKTILSNWERDGVSRELAFKDILEKAPYFLKSMEDTRLKISNNENIDSGYSRLQETSVVLIKGLIKGNSYFLHQWDDLSQQFQLIGGKKRVGEEHLETAKRELHEEITQHDLVYGKDYDLILLSNPQQPITYREVSKTYGALTEYRLWVYGVKFNLNQLTLSKFDKWISVNEMRKGLTNDNQSIRNAEICRIIDSILPNGLEGVQVSINKIQKNIHFFDYLEIKPQFLGFLAFDIKSFFQNLFK
nr:hypothetical protein [Nostoc sp. ChiQUE02]MDZ8232843.1 hypothetical protein [Nostoc sp. ChiQUE02]